MPHNETHALGTFTHPNIQGSNPKARLSCPYITVDNWTVYIEHIQAIKDAGSLREILLRSGDNFTTSLSLVTIKNMIEAALIHEQTKPA